MDLPLATYCVTTVKLLSITSPSPENASSETYSYISAIILPVLLSAIFHYKAHIHVCMHMHMHVHEREDKRTSYHGHTRDAPGKPPKSRQSLDLGASQKTFFLIGAYIHGRVGYQYLILHLFVKINTDACAYDINLYRSGVQVHAVVSILPSPHQTAHTQ